MSADLGAHFSGVRIRLKSTPETIHWWVSGTDAPGCMLVASDMSDDDLREEIAKALANDVNERRLYDIEQMLQTLDEYTERIDDIIDQMLQTLNEYTEQIDDITVKTGGEMDDCGT